MIELYEETNGSNSIIGGRKRTFGENNTRLPTGTEGEEIAYNISLSSGPKDTITMRMQSSKTKKTVKKTFLGKEWVLNCQALCGKIGCHWGDCGRKL